MSIATAFMALALLSLALLVILWPFLTARLQRMRYERPAQISHVMELEEQLNQSLKTIRDLDFDYDMGKVGEEDYTSHRKYLIGRGVSLLIRLDEARDKQATLDHDIEQMIAAQRAGLTET